MTNKSGYSRSISLQGFTSVFTIEVGIDDLDTLQLDIEGEYQDQVAAVRMQISLRFSRQAEEIAVRRSISVWADEVYDLLDLSLCMAHLAERENTTEELSDMERQTTYVHNVQWMMSQSLPGCGVRLFSKNTPRFAGQRFIEFLFSTDEQAPAQSITARLLSASPEEVHRFAAQLREVHEEIQELLSGP